MDGLSELEGSILKAVQQCDRTSPVRKQSLAFRFSIDPRTVRAIVSRLREQGYPVLCSSASNGGYYWPRTPEEVHTFIQREIVSRTKVLHKQQAAMKKNLHVHFGQMDL